MLRFVVGLLAICCLTACEKHSGEAVVLEKENIAAAIEMPSSEGNTNASESGASSPSDETLRPMTDDEIAVDSYVMKRDVRGTGRDPRALKDEQWLVKVQVVSDGRIFNVHAERTQFDGLKVGDRVQVSYRVGKYTKTVWGSQIDEIRK